MKSKHQKYEEARDRNVRRSLGKQKYNDCDLEQIKHALGIRQSDTAYDAEIKARIK